MIIFVVRNDAGRDATTEVDIETKSNYLPRKEADGYIVAHLNIIVKITLNVTSLLRGSFILIIKLNDMNFTINIHKVRNKTQPIINPYDILPKECWKEVDSYSDYLVSQNGDVYSKITCKLLKYHILNSGYALVTLYKDKFGKNYLVHRLVAESFIKNPNNNIYTDIDHIDGNKTNNNIANLRWCTHRVNSIIRDSKPVTICDSFGNIKQQYKNLNDLSVAIKRSLRILIEN